MRDVVEHVDELSITQLRPTATTTKPKEKRTSNWVASRCTRSCTTVAVFVRHIKNNFVCDMATCGARDKSNFTIDRLCWRVWHRGLNELMLIAMP